MKNKKFYTTIYKKSCLNKVSEYYVLSNLVKKYRFCNLNLHILKKARKIKMNICLKEYTLFSRISTQSNII